MGCISLSCGSLLLFCATVLLVVATISSPVVQQISLFNVYSSTGTFTGTSTFGVFGYCIAGSSCSSRQIGYDISRVVAVLEALGVNGIDQYTGYIGWTKALVLHPIAAGLSFISMFVTCCSNHWGFLFASLIAFLAFIVSVLALVLDLVVTTLIKNAINNNADLQANNVSAAYGNAIWLVLAATVLLFFGSFIACFECCSTTRRRRRDASYVGNGRF